VEGKATMCNGVLSLQTSAEGCSWYDQVNLKSSKQYFVKFIDSHHLDYNKASENQLQGNQVIPVQNKH